MIKWLLNFLVSNVGQHMANAVLLSQNMKRGVIFEKYTTPAWFIEFVETHSNQYILSFSHLYLYRILLRVLNGDDVTITLDSEAQINKWRKRPEIFPIGFATLLIETGIIGLEGGNDDTKEEHYNIYSR